MSEIRVGILGLGTIGLGAARILIEQQSLMARRSGKTLRLVAAADRSLGRDFGVDLSAISSDFFSGFMIWVIGSVLHSCRFFVNEVQGTGDL